VERDSLIKGILMAATNSNQQRMEKCQFCKGDIDPMKIPSICSYCRGMFCNQHRLPKSHGCSYKHQKKPMTAGEVRGAGAHAAQPAAATTAAPSASASPQPQQPHTEHAGHEEHPAGHADEENRDVIRGVDGTGRWTLFKRRLFGGR
jgi:hypothetical protein